MASLDPRIEYVLVQAGFSDVAKLGQVKIDDTLVTTLVERWRLESNMFHLPIVECIITLEDVALQLGLRIDGRPVTSPTYYD